VNGLVGAIEEVYLKNASGENRQGYLYADARCLSVPWIPSLTLNSAEVTFMLMHGAWLI
jgi:hypothetical protein